MFRRNVAQQIHMIQRASVNCYIVEDGPQVMLVDAGLPGMWDMTVKVLRDLGHTPDDLKALLITHAHFDHLGFAAKLQRDHGVQVFVHDADAHIAVHPYRYRPEKNRFLYPFKYPASIPIQAAMVRAGALSVKGITDFGTLQTGPTPALPGQPVIIHTPGHTNGECVLHFPERDAVITGDALVTLNPYTGRTGAQIISAAATTDTSRALDSLSLIAGTGARIILPGHGEPYDGGAAAAVEQARAAGAS